MQNQNTNNLQQQKSDLQQGTPNLQQSGTPSSTLDTSGVLSEAAPKGSLQVTTTQAPSASTIQPDSVQPNGNDLWLLLLIIPFVLVVAIFWPRKDPVVIVEDEPEPTPKPAAKTVAAKKNPQTKKKSPKRKKAGRR